MIEVYPNLFIGNETDYELRVRGQEGWFVVQACKEPYHRQALGYTGRAVANTHPEYLLARRDNRLILNLVDVENPAYISDKIMDAALDFIHEHLSEGEHVLVHCNQGESRSPSIGLLYLAAYTDGIPHSSLQEAETVFRNLYPTYNPKGGMRGFLAANWRRYCKTSES